MWMLLHGFTGSPKSWDAVVARGDFDRDPLRPTLTGHGIEWRASAARSFQDEVARVSTLASSLDPPRFVAGYSLGARVALGMLVASPECFDGALLIGVHPGLADEDARAERRALDAGRADQLRTEGLPAFVAQWESQALFETQRSLPEEIRRRQREIRLEHDPEGLVHSLETLGLGAMPNYARALSSNRVPITLMAGARDSKFRDLAIGLADRSPNIESVIVDGAGHNLIVEATDAVVTALARVQRAALERRR